MRIIEHLPVVGHVIAACHACAGNKTEAERAAMNATIGLVLFPVNMVAEIVDEVTRERSSRIKQSHFTSRPDWMRRQRQRTLRNICLPGSHQSATSHTDRRLNYSPMSLGWARCQRHDVRAQLEAGVRFLDVGVTSHGAASSGRSGAAEIWCRSGEDRRPVALCVRLRDVLGAVRDFVASNPSEIVAIHVTSGDGGGDRRASVNWTDCQSVVNEVLRDKLVPEHMRDMPIGDIVDQGRNVIVFGLPEAKFSWQQLQYRWPNKAQPGQLENHMRGTLQEIGLYRPTDLFWYRAECTPSEKVFVRSVGGLVGLIAARHGGPEKFDSLEHLAACANRVVLRVLGDVGQLPFNVLTMDFISDQIIGRIIELNEMAERGQPLTAVLHESTDEADDVFALPTQRLMLNTTLNSSVAGTGGAMTAGNTSFDFRLPAAPPVQVHETTM